jgi:hypothetical protein
LVSLAAMFGSTDALSQQVGGMRLRPSDAIAEETFSRITSIRELPDGSLLVADQGDSRLALLNFASKTVTAIGRSGDGPGEFRTVGWVFRLPGDSTLFTDVFLSRWFILTGSKIVETISERMPVNRLLLSELSGVDSFGHVLGVRGSVFTGDAPRLRGNADSLVLLLANRRTQLADTLEVLKGRGSRGYVREPPKGGQMPRLIFGSPLASEDQALLFQDGWIAVARTEPYRVDWRAAGGRWYRGNPLPYQPVKVDDREKCAATERFLGRQGPCDPAGLPGWPGLVPPFLPPTLQSLLPSLLAMPDGRLAIARTPTTRSRSYQYDLIDRSGRLVGVLDLEKNERLLGFGVRSVYVVVTDDDGVQTIRRHPWP